MHSGVPWTSCLSALVGRTRILHSQSSTFPTISSPCFNWGSLDPGHGILNSAPLSEICSAATWSSLSTFTRFYSLNMASLSSAPVAMLPAVIPVSGYAFSRHALAYILHWSFNCPLVVWKDWNRMLVMHVTVVLWSCGRLPESLVTQKGENDRWDRNSVHPLSNIPPGCHGHMTMEVYSKVYEGMRNSTSIAIAFGWSSTPS